MPGWMHVRLLDRLAAYRHRPDWSDRVQVLLWLLGWSIPIGVLLISGLFLAALASTGGLVPWLRSGAFAVASLLALLYVLGWAVVGSWFVSEAYRTWQAGSRHGKYWSMGIGAYLVFSLLPFLAFGSDDAVRTGVAAVRASLGFMLLILAVVTPLPEELTEPPASA